MRQKVLASFDEAVADVFDGAKILFGGFAAAGVPRSLIEALLRRGAKDLTAVCNGVGGFRPTIEVHALVEAGMVRKIITNFPISNHPSQTNLFEKLYREGKIELELSPQGTMAERLRATGAGIPAFYTPTGAGTPFEQGKEKQSFSGREHLLEYALGGDFAFVRAHKADTLGNLVYRKAARNFNPVMATAAGITIAEVDAIVEPGNLDPESIVTPGIYVDRIVKIAPG